MKNESAITTSAVKNVLWNSTEESYDFAESNLSTERCDEFRRLELFLYIVIFSSESVEIIIFRVN